ncbi:unnamed protein product [Candidula unifasciata]|uniref:Uncharacterized protein n=1 Tax=Candidula unifasciata TaxID=100452 RepID=A0A8S3ZDK7_9EUPU|nr:unnamed protein product [Candidula unifasciata]
MDILLCFGGFLLLAAFVVDVVSVASAEWVVVPVGSTYGLWAKCFSTGSCVPVTRTDELDGVRAVMVISVIISGLALLVVLVNIASIWISQRTNRWIVRLVTVVTFLSAIMTLVGILLSREVTWDVGNTDDGYSFWLGVAAIVLFFISGIFFFVSAVRYHQARKQRKRLQEKSTKQKKYPFVIPYYDYETNQNENNGQQTTDLENEKRSLGRISNMYPFNFEHRYFPTSILGNAVSRLGDPIVVNELNVSRYSSGLPTMQLPGQQFLTLEGNKVDETQSSVYSKSQPRMDTNTTITSGNMRTAEVPPSLFATPSLLGISSASPKIPRDNYGYPLNYNRDI